MEKETDELRKQLNAHTASLHQIRESATTMMPKSNPADNVKRNKASGVCIDANDAEISCSNGAEGLQLLFQDIASDVLPHLTAATSESPSSNGSKLPEMVPGSIYKNTASGQTRPQPLQPPVGMGPVVSKKKNLAMAGVDPDRTLPRTLGGVTLSGDEIDEIFNM